MNRKPFLLIHLAVWLMLFLSPLTYLYHDENFSYLQYLMMCVMPLALMFVFYLNYLWLVPRFFLVKDQQTTYWVVNAFLMLCLGVFTHYWLAYVHFNFSLTSRPHTDLTPVETLVFIIRNVFNLAIAAAVATAIQLSVRWHNSEDARLHAEAARAEAELRNLRSQINPHFLLNTLNNIYALIAIDTERAQDAIQQLSKLLRHLLYDNQELLVNLTDEVQFLENYINLMKIRLPQTVDVQLDKQIRKPDVRIAPLIFISLIENAFKHGISPTEPSFIHISLSTDVERVGDYDVCDIVTCTIENSNHPKTQQDRSGHGVGLEQVQRRLDLLYLNRYQWEKGSNDDGKTYFSRITLRI